MPADLYADEHFPMQIVNHLRRLGHNVLTVRQTNISKAGDAMPDELVLEYATQHRRAVLTQNRTDFERLASQDEYRGHEGIIICAVEQDDKALAKLIDAEIKVRDGRLTGQVIRLKLPRRN